MKKFLLFFCALIVTQMAYAWYVVGSTSTFGSWTPANAPVMTETETESGVFVLSDVTIDKGAEFKFIKTQAWGNELAYNGTIFANEDKAVTSGIHNTKWGGEPVTGNIVLNTKTNTMQVVVEGAEEIEEVDYFVYFDNSKSNWSKVYVYTYGGYDMGAWPGLQVTETNSEGYYKVKISSKVDPSGCGLVFNNGEGSQTADLTWVNDGIYDVNGAIEYKSVKIYVEQTGVLETNAYLYYWGSVKNVPTWPGVEMTETEDIEDKTYWVATIEANGSFNIILNNGNGQKTANIEGLSNEEDYYKYSVKNDWNYDVTTGIEEVGVDAGEAVYYNLQGVKVANPENGIFIKKQGNKTTKVVL